MRKLIVSGFGLGFSPFAPGTTGTVPAVAIYLLVAQLPYAYAEAANIALLLLFSALSIWLVPWCETHWGKKDPKPFVLDEMAGYFMAILFLPPEVPLWLRASAGFFVARAMDVIKPFPARRLEALPAGWGVLLDDIFASIYANVILQFGLRWWLANKAG